MDAQQDSADESLALLFCLLAGVVVAAVLAPKDDYFFMNFVFYWIPQAIVIGILLTFSSRPAVVSGAAITLAVYLAAYGAWLYFSTTDHAGLTWLGYVFSLPGAAIGAITGALFIKKNNYQRAMFVGAVVATTTLVGLILNQLLVCSTVLYCHF